MPLLNSPNQDSDRRKLLAAAGLWRFSWRSSKKKLQEERDDTSTTNLTIEKKNKRVQFNPSASLLPITPSLDDTVDSNLSWYQVSVGLRHPFAFISQQTRTNSSHLPALSFPLFF